MKPKDGVSSTTSPIVVVKPDPDKGLVFESETPAGRPGAVTSSNPGGVPEPCSPVEAKPLGTCANPHGIQIRADLGRMVTGDYAEPRELTTDPVKPYEPATFRPTVRVWDVTTPGAPRLVSVARMPKGPQATMLGHGNIAIMEAAKTHAPAKGMFAGASCGGGLFFTPDVTVLAGDSSAAWKQVFVDDMALLRASGVDGNHRLYMVDVDPATGALAYDQSFRDEKDGALGVDFNRRHWPRNPDAGFYKPHAMVWVCPPGVCRSGPRR
ncbi:MAG: hypothetical protein AB1679_03835 [Actinomycetota bacterium]